MSALLTARFTGILQANVGRQDHAFTGERLSRASRIGARKRVAAAGAPPRGAVSIARTSALPITMASEIAPTDLAVAASCMPKPTPTGRRVYVRMRFMRAA